MATHYLGVKEDLRRRALNTIRYERQSEAVKGERPFNIVGLLKACESEKDLGKGSTLHAYICEHALFEKNPYIGSTLVNMYAKCGALTKAQAVLEELPIRDVVTWNALLAGYTQLGQAEEALKYFENLLYEGQSPDAVTFTCALKACGTIGAAAKGEKIHDKIANLGILEKDIVLASSLVDMYTKCGALAKAQQVLEELPVRNVVTWSALIAGYAQRGRGEEALKCFDRMQDDGHSPNAVTFSCALKACASIGAAAKGEELHDKIVSSGMLKKDIVLGTTLVDMYIKCGALTKAQQVLEELPTRDAVSWSALIAGYAQLGQWEKALRCFDDMQCEGHSPNAVTFICVLKACGGMGAVAKGEEVHDKIVSLGMLEKDIVLGNALVDMYTKCGALSKAQRVAEELPVRDVFTWTTLITGYAQQGKGEEALKCLDNLQREGHAPNAVTFISALKASGSIGAVTRGDDIYCKVVSVGMLEKDIVLGSTVVDMYIKCGVLSKAQRVLQELHVRDVVTWSALISGYVQHGQGEEALNCFENMLCEGLSPDAVTFICVLKACGSIGAAAKGEEIHNKIVSLDMLEKDIVLGNTLVDMYAKCGAVAKAEQVLNELPIRDVATWNALIAGYAQQAQCWEAISCFERMRSKGVKLDSFTLSSVLKACNHSGILGLAELFFTEMNIKYGIHPDFEHYYYMTDLFSRAGKLDKALLVLGEVPSDKCLPYWIALLGACRKWGEVNIGRLAFEHAVHLDKSYAAIYVLMADIYAAAGVPEEADKIEHMRVENKAWRMAADIDGLM